MFFEEMRKLFHFKLSTKEGPNLVVPLLIIKLYFLTLEKEIENSKKKTKNTEIVTSVKKNSLNWGSE